MKFATFMLNNTFCAGIFNNGGYYTFSDLLGSDAPKTILNFILEYEDKTIPDFDSLIAKTNIKPVDVNDIKLCAPIPNPFRNVICLGKNYADHAKEVVETKLSTQDENFIPSAPIYFTKNANPAFGNGDVISLHSHMTQKVDYEVELAVIIGKTAKQIKPEETEQYIFGYTILNDVTARDVQTKYGQWYFGKSLDGFCPMGPHIVTKDEMPFPIKEDVCCRVNGEIRQASNTSLFIYDIPRIISELSQGMTLYPGDIIATGTPAGIGHAMKPPTYLKSGDKVECEIQNVGVLTNYFV